MFRSVLTKLYSKKKYSNKYSISAQHVVMLIYRNKARLQEQKEYTGLPLTLRIQDILYKNTEQKSKKMNEQDRPKMMKIGFENHCMLNTVKMTEILPHLRI